MKLRRERRITWDLLVKPADHAFILLKLGDEDVGITLNLASHPIIWTPTMWSSIMVCDDMGGKVFMYNQHEIIWNLRLGFTFFQKRCWVREGGDIRTSLIPGAGAIIPAPQGMAQAPQASHEGRPSKTQDSHTSEAGSRETAGLWPEYSEIHEIRSLESPQGDEAQGSVFWIYFVFWTSRPFSSTLCVCVCPLLSLAEDTWGPTKENDLKSLWSLP